MGKKENARRFLCMGCDAVHHYAARTCQECGFGCLGEKPIPLNDKSFPVGRRVVAKLPNMPPGPAGLRTIRGAVVGVVGNSWGKVVIVKADHDSNEYRCKFQAVLWEAKA